MPSEPMSEIQQHAAKLGWIEGELAREHHRYAAQLAATTSAILDYYEPLAELGQAVLDEHRTALLAERALQDPELQAAAAVAQYHVRELLSRAFTAQEQERQRDA
jgi:hypothetical protein